MCNALVPGGCTAQALPHRVGLSDGKGGRCAPEMLAGNHILPLVTMAGRVVGWGGSRLGDEEGAAPWVPGEGWLKDSAQQQEAAGENVCLALLLHSPSAGTHTPAGLRQPDRKSVV